MSKPVEIKAMSKVDLENEVMLLRAQVKCLQNWVALHKRGITFDGSPEAQERIRQRFGPYHD